MKKILTYITVLLLMASPVAAQQFGGGAGGTGVQLAADCDVAAYYALGTLCQDTGTAKLYKGTGAAVVELAAGASGDVTSVGDCATGACLDGTSDGGTYISMYGGALTKKTSIYASNSAADLAFYLPTTALARGSFLIGSASTVLGYLAVGTTGKIVTTDGTDPSWSAYTVAAPGSAGAVLYSDGTNWTRSATPALTSLNLTGTNSLGLGTSGSLIGTINFKGDTSGSLTVQPITGALGTPTLVLGTTYTDAHYCTYATATGLTCNQDPPAGTGDFKADGSVAMTGAIVPDSAGGRTIGTGALPFSSVYIWQCRYE
jgi:hypothetical protein